MSMMHLSELYCRIQSLAVFRELLNDPAIESLYHYLQHALSGETVKAVSSYGEFISRLYASGTASLAAHIQDLVSNNENTYIRMVGQKQQPWPELEDCLQQELNTLQTIADLTPESLRSSLNYSGYLPRFQSESVDIPGNYSHRCGHIHELGYGIYARHHMFYIDPENRIVPVQNPDQTRLSSLVDYKREQQIILDNTMALLDGKPAANILLTGDAGTGKSSTIKAVVNELHHRGLRILEVRKEQLRQIPGVLDELNCNPLKFILFIDDLSFQKDDDHFSALKAILEGSVSAKSHNVVIYATSNRRHLVKESFSQRDGDDIHRNDTMQEIISLSERFGIQITFQKPNRETYLDIVHHLAAQRGIQMAPARLDLLAEQFVLNRGGRSARAAAQFVDSLVAAQP